MREGRRENKRLFCHASTHIILRVTVLFFALFAFSCSFLSDDGFFSTIESEVSVANAEKMSVYLRYAAIKFGTTTPANASNYQIKNNVAFSVTATTNSEYGFYKWAAFSKKDFDISKQWTSLIFTSEEDYTQNFGCKELDSSIVYFSEPTAPTTEVKVMQTRDDIWIMPVVAERPTIRFTLPNTSTQNIVRNTKLRVQFSKPMSAASFEGNYKITEGVQGLDADGNITFNGTDFTDYFNLVFSSTEEMVTFSFKDDAEKNDFSANATVQLSFSNEIADSYGYEMADSKTLEWSIGTAFDRLAPEITILTGGIEDDCHNFASVDTATSESAQANLDYSLYTDELLAQRTTGKVNIYVYAQDISGSKDNVSPLRVESDVNMIGFRAMSLVDRDGNVLDTSLDENKLAASVSAYSAGLNSSEISGNFETITNSDTVKGSLYTYDISSLPDGLARIDVWAYDGTGNSGLTEEHYLEYNNGFKSIFVVKDSAAPNIEAELAKVRSSSVSAPYGWYNSNSIDPIEMYDEAANPVVDVGHEKLRASHDNLQWIFRLGDDTNWTVLRTDAAWKSLSERYPVGNARVDSDGSVSITMRLMDDLGNMSEAMPLSSVLYDNTKVQVDSLSWIDTTGGVALNATQSAEIPDYSLLKIPFTEELSGLRVLGINVKDSNGNLVANAFDSASVFYAEDADSLPSLANAISFEASNAILENVTESPHYTPENPLFTDTLENLHIFPAELKTGVLYIKNLTVGDADGVYIITATLYDSALNRSEAATITIAHDTTAPTVDRVIVEDVVERIVYGESEKTWWLPQNVYDSERKANLARVCVTATENGSGIKIVKLGENAHLTANSDIYKDGTALNTDDYVLDVSANTISLSDSYNPVLYAQNGSIVFTITNVELDNPDSEDGNVVSVTLTDFVENNGSNVDSSDNSKFRLYIDDTSSTPIYAIYGDTNSPSVSKNAISDGKADSASDEATYDSLRLSSDYTDQNKVTLTLTLASEAVQHGSGIKSLTLQNATFTTDTAISVDGASLSGGFTFSGDSVTFEKVFAGANEIIFTNVLLSGSDGSLSVGAVATDLTGWISEYKASNDIILDTQMPECAALSWELVNGVTGVTKSALIESQNLVVPFSEETSGIRQLALETKENGVEATTTPFRDAGFALSYAENGSSSRTALNQPTDYEIDGSRIKLTKPFKSGTFYLKNLIVTDSFADSRTYELSVHFTDFALNGALTDEKIAIVSDATAPKLESIEIEDLIPRVKAGESEADSHWVSQKNFTAANTAPTKSVLAMSVSEKASGIKTIALSGTIRLTDSSEITVRYSDGTEKTLENGSDYEVSNENALITLKNASSPLLKDENGVFSLSITNTTLTSSGENTISATLTDFALNSGFDSTRENKTFVDKTLPTFASLSISDRGTTSETVAAKSGFTNENLVNLTFADSYDSDSGLSGIVIDSGATFTAETTLEINGTAVPFTKVSDSEIKFAYSYLSENSSDKFTIFVKNVSLSSDSDGTHSVSSHLIDTVQWASVSKSATITLDKTPPEWNEALPVVTGENTVGVYPATGKAGEKIERETYFYIIGTDSQGSEMKLSLNYTEAHFAGAIYSDSSSTISAILAESDAKTADTNKNIPFITNGDATYSIVLKDDAGNVSSVCSFHIIRDSAITTNAGYASDSLTSVMEKSDSRTGYQVYLEKQAQSDGSYRNRFSTTNGKTVSVSVVLSSYTERTPSMSQSGLAYFAINDSSTTAPTTNGTATDFNKWILYNSESETVTVFIPNENSLKGPYYLWLKDNVGNTNKIQIRTQAHESNSVNETWLGSASVENPSLIDYTLGTVATATTGEDGKLVTADGITYYNSKSKYGLKGEGGILFSGAASQSDYPVRFAIVNKNTTTVLTKSEISAISDWVYPEDFNSASSEYKFINQVYPNVDYKYLHYVIEDATGNFATGLLNPLSSATAPKWKYDDDEPKVTLRGTATAPDSVTDSALQTLVPPHYGRQVFYDSSKSKVWVSPAGTLSDSSATTGTNTYHKTEKLLYFDVDIAEDTKITQYCYSTSESIPTSGSWTASSNGKVDTCIPTSLLSSATRLYLHVRDIVGNIGTYPLSTLKWQLDENAPDFADTISPSYKLKENYYYASPITDSNTISIALSGTAYSDSSVKVTIPRSWFTDGTDGSEVYSYSIENSGKIVAPSYDSDDTDNPCIVLTKGTHYSESGKSLSLYIYDSVGNYKTVAIKTRVDQTPPTFKLAFDIDGSATFKHPAAGDVTVNLTGKDGLIYDSIEKTVAVKNLSVAVEYQSNLANETQAGYTENNPYIIYAAPASTYADSNYYVIGTFTAADDDTSGTTTGGISDIRVDRKVGETGSYTNDYLTMDNLNNVATTPESQYIAKVPIDLDADGRTYRITVSDFAGNSTVVFIKLFLDKTAPSFTENPTVRAEKGTINTNGTNYYFNEMSLSFSGKDKISPTNAEKASGTKTYEILSGTTAIKTADVADGDDGFSVSLSPSESNFASHTNGNKLSVRLTDNLGNVETSNLYFDGTEITKNWIRDTSAPRINSISVDESNFGRLDTSTTETILYYADNLKNAGKTHNFAVSVTAFDGLSSSTGTDGGIMGYFVSSESNANSYSSVSSTISLQPRDYVASSSSGTAYLYAVDFAGNISAGFPVKIQKDENTPVISNGSASGTSEESGTNVIFFNTNSSVTFTLKDANTQIVEYGLASSDDGTGDNFASTKTEISLAKNTSQSYTLTFANLSAAEKNATSATLYAYATNTQGNTTYYALPHETAKIWKYDGEAATVKNVVSSSEKTYPRSSAIENGGTLYYNTAISQISLKVTFNEDTSGITGYKLGSSSAETKNITLDSDNSVTISVSATNGALSLFGVDALGNVSEEFKITLSGIAHAPDISAVTVTKDAGVLYQNETTGSYFYNGSVGTLTLTPSLSSVEPTEIVGFTTNSSASQKDSQSSATAYEKAAASSDAGETVTLYAVNAVGAASANGFTVTLIRDTEKPSLSSLTVSSSLENSVNKNGATLYYNSTVTTATVSAADSSSGIAGYAISTSETAPDSTEWKTSASLSLPAKTNEKFYIFIKDNVENIFVEEFSALNSEENPNVAQFIDYTGNSRAIPSGATWTSDNEKPASSEPVSIALSSETATLSGHGIYLDGKTLYYNEILLGSSAISYNLTGESGIMGFKFGSNEISSSVMISDVAATNKILAVDYAGNISDSAYTFVFTKETSVATILAELDSGKVYATALIDDYSDSKSLDESQTYWTNGSYTAKISVAEDASSSGIDSVTASGRGSLSEDGGNKILTVTKPTSETPEEVTITVKSKAGTENHFMLKTALDETAPALSNLTLSNDDEIHSVNADGDSVLYYNSGFVTLSVTATDDRGIFYSLVKDGAAPADWSETLPSMPSDASGNTLTIYAKDALGNGTSLAFAGNAKYISASTASGSTQTAAAGAKWTCDNENPAVPTTVSASVADGEGIFLNLPEIFYSTSVLGSSLTNVTFTPLSSDNLEILGYRTVKNSRETEEISVDFATNPASLEIYSVDYAGNVSSDPLTLTLTKDETKPVITVKLSQSADNTTGKITSDNTNLISVNSALSSGTAYYSNSRFYTVSVSVEENDSGTSNDLVKVDDVAFTESPYSITLTGAGSKIISAKDKVGNVADSFVLTTALDNAGPVLSDLRITNTDATHSVNASGTVIYYNPAAVKVSATAEDDRTISHYVISDSDLAPDSDSDVWISGTSISDVALGTFSGKALYLYAKDILDNVSEAYAFAGNAKYVSASTASGSSETADDNSVWTSDNEKPATPTSISLTDSDLNGNGLYLVSSESTTLFYNKEMLGSGTTSVSVTPTAESGVMGWRLTETGTSFSTSLDLPFATSPAKIYAIDYAGNISEPYELSLVEETSESVSVIVKFNSGKIIGEGGTQLISSGTVLSKDVTYYTTGSYSVSLDANADETSSGIKEATSSANGEISLSGGSGETEIPEPVASGSTVTFSVKTNVGTVATFVLTTALDNEGPKITGITLAQKADTQTKVVEDEENGVVYYNSENTYISAIDIDTDSEKFPLETSLRKYMILSAESGYDTESALVAGDTLLLGTHESETESSAIFIATEDLFGTVKYTKLSELSSIKYAGDSAAVSGIGLKWKSLDSVAPPTSVAIDNTLDGSGAYLPNTDTEPATLYYNVEEIGEKDFKITPSSVNTTMFDGYATSSSETSPTATIMIAKASVPESLEIFAFDKVGNVSDAYTLTLTADTVAVSGFAQQVGEENDSFEKVNLFTGYIGEQEINCYKGLKLKVALTENKVPPTAYALVFADENATEIAKPTDTDWQTISNENYTDSVLTVSFGEDITTAKQAWLWVKDAVGTKTMYATALGNPKSETRRAGELLWLPYTVASSEINYALDTENKALYLSELSSGYPVQTLTFVENGTSFLSDNTISKVLVYTTKDGDSSASYEISTGVSLTPETDEAGAVISVSAELAKDYILPVGVIKLVFENAISSEDSSLAISSVQVKCSKDSTSTELLVPNLVENYTTLLSASASRTPTGFFSGLVYRATNAISSVLKTRSMSHEEKVALKEAKARQKAEERALREKEKQSRISQISVPRVKNDEMFSQWQGLGEEFDEASRELDSEIKKLSASQGKNSNDFAQPLQNEVLSGGNSTSTLETVLSDTEQSEPASAVPTESDSNNLIFVILLRGTVLLFGSAVIFITKKRFFGKKNEINEK